jgi:hypothetical protein
MADHQEDEFTRLGPPFGGLPLHAIDCQGLFCETDKYCHEAAPELASARKRIKARFTAAPEPVQLFFPPEMGHQRSAARRACLQPAARARAGSPVLTADTRPAASSGERHAAPAQDTVPGGW